MQSIKEFLLVNRKEFSQYAIATAGLGTVGVVILFLVMLSLKPDTYIYLGSCFAFFGVVLLYVFMGIFGYTADFNLAVSMGVTRKKFVLGYLVQSLLSSIMMSGILLLFYILESSLYHRVFKEAVLDMDSLAKGVAWKLVLCAIAVVPVFRLAMGAFIMKFQKVGFWVMWAVWMAFCLFGSRWCKIMENENSFLHKAFAGLFEVVKGLPQAALLALGAGALILILCVAWLLARRQSVTSA